MKQTALDLICIGRAGVDLCGEQIGGRLEDMGSFAKYVGGSPANTAIGASRLGLKSAMLTRVGDEHLDRFIRETMNAEGVDTRQVHRPRSSDSPGNTGNSGPGSFRAYLLSGEFCRYGTGYCMRTIPSTKIFRGSLRSRSE